MLIKNKIIIKILILFLVIISFARSADRPDTVNRTGYSRIEITAIDWSVLMQYQQDPDSLKDTHLNNSSSEYNYLSIKQPVKIAQINKLINQLQCTVMENNIDVNLEFDEGENDSFAVTTEINIDNSEANNDTFTVATRVDGRFLMNMYHGDDILMTYFADWHRFANLTTNELCEVDESFWNQFGFFFEYVSREQVLRYRDLTSPLLPDESDDIARNIIDAKIEITVLDWFDLFHFQISPDYLQNLHAKYPNKEHDYFLIKNPAKVMVINDIINSPECITVNDAEKKIDGRIFVKILDKDNNTLATYFASRYTLANLTKDQVCDIDDQFWKQFGFLIDQ